MQRIFIIFILFLAFGCQNYSPKPKAYPRIYFPDKAYVKAETDCPFTFEIPKYSKLTPYNSADQPCWYNLNFPQFKATLHLTYVPVANMNGIDSLTEEAYKMAFEHISVAEEIIEREIVDSAQNLYGIVYDLEGKTATPINFYLTDQKNKFFRGSFYFNERTNLDSIRPIYDFIRKDIMHSIETFSFQ